MKHPAEMARRAHTVMVRLVNGLHEDVKLMEATIDSQGRQISEFVAQEQASIQVMEQEQCDRKDVEVKRRKTLSDKALIADLERQYGHTNWAKRVILGILKNRNESEDIRWPIAQGV